MEKSDVVLSLLLSLLVLEDATDREVTARVASDGVGNGRRLGDDAGNRVLALLVSLPPPFFLQWPPLHFDCEGSCVIGENATAPGSIPDDEALTARAHAAVRDLFIAFVVNYAS